MPEATVKLTCATCNGATTPGTARCSVLRMAATPSNPAGKVFPDLSNAPASTVFCSDQCMNIAGARAQAKGKCSVCLRRFDRTPGSPGGDRPGPGVPPSYCSDACRSAHEKTVSTALKELARGTIPAGDLAKVEDALTRGHALLNYWTQPVGPTALRPPDRLAHVALRERLERLTEKREQLLTEQRAAAEASKVAKARAAWRRRADALEAQDKKWREAVLK